MKIYCAYFAHESNSFSPLPTNLESYRESCLYLPSTGEGVEFSRGGFTDETAFIAIAKDRGHSVVIGPMACTTPSAPTLGPDYERIRDEMLDTLRQAMPVDAVMLSMHGAQLAVGYDDCGGDILKRIRSLVGDTVPIGVELDLHCNISPRMLASADSILPCKEYPHTDFEHEGERLVTHIEAMRAGECTPQMQFLPVPLLGYFHTTRKPMSDLVAAARGYEMESGILSVSICHGFGLADSPHTGAGILVISDRNIEACSDRATQIASELAGRLFESREQIKAPLCSINSALDIVEANDEGVIVISDTTDNSGGGAAGDSTFVLQALMSRGIRDVAVALLWDPMVVALASRAGLGAKLGLRLGGKIGPGSGQPIDVEASVVAVKDDAVQMMFNSPAPLGSAVALEFQGITVVVNSVREQVFDPHCFSAFGIDPWRQRALVVKSSQHFYAAFAPFAKQVLYVDAPGSTTANFGKLNYQNLRRPIWPLDEVPFEAHGRIWQ